MTEAQENGRNTGIPERIDGLAGVATDAEALRLENMLRDGIAPRLPGVRVRWVTGFPKGPVLIIRIPQSWAGPHMVTFKQHSRFYARNAAGKYILDVFELRQAFLARGSVAERAREFRAERLGRLFGGDGPVPLTSRSLFCVHIVPHWALSGAVDIDLQRAATRYADLEPLYSYSRSSRFNLDGFLTHSVAGQDPSSLLSGSYLQLFRNGIIETVTADLLRPRKENAPLAIPCQTFALELATFASRARQLLKTLEVEPPASLFVSLLGVRGAVLGVSEGLTFFGRINPPKPFDRDNLLFRDLIIADWESEDSPKLVKPILDELWQASGLARCYDFDEQGNWKPHP